METFVARFADVIGQELLEPMGKLEQFLLDFCPTSAKEAKVAEVKASMHELEPLTVSAVSGPAELDKPVSEEVAAAQALVEKAHTMLAHWGLHSCAKHDDVEHILRGACLRLSIKNILENCHWLLSSLRPELVSRCQELTAKGGSQLASGYLSS